MGQPTEVTVSTDNESLEDVVLSGKREDGVARGQVRRPARCLAENVSAGLRRLESTKAKQHAGDVWMICGLREHGNGHVSDVRRCERENECEHGHVGDVRTCALAQCACEL
jgi:hypothetical protein